MQSEQMPLSLLQNGLSLSQFFPSFLSIVSAFWEDCRQFSAPCCLSLLPLGRPQHCYPLPCQQLPKRQYSRNFSLRGGGEGKICASLSPFPNVLVMLKSLLILPHYDKNNNKITGGLPWNFFNFNAVLPTFPSISQANSQECFRWMSKCVI